MCRLILFLVICSLLVSVLVADDITPNKWICMRITESPYFRTGHP